MNIFVTLIIMIASYLISNAMKPKQHTTEAKPALDDDITFPQPDEGTKQAVIFGEAWLPNWAVLWHGNYRANPVKDHGTTIGYQYSYSMLMGLCQGPIDEVIEILVGDRSAYHPEDDNSARIVDSMPMTINRPTLFGGTPQGQGGIVTYGWFLNGHDDQLLPGSILKGRADASGADYVPLTSMMPGFIPGYRGMATFLWDGYVAYNDTNPQPWTFRVRRALAGWDGATFYPERAIIPMASGDIIIPNPQLSDPNISDDDKRSLVRTVTINRTIMAMNPAHILIEGMTNRTWGRGLTLDQIDVASYRDAADILYGEGLGAATKWDRSGTLEEFMQTIIDYIGAAQYPDPLTGLIKLHLIRGDYDVNSIPTFTYTSGLMSITDNAANASDNSANQMIITYTSPITGKKGQVRAQNTALITAQDSIIIQSKTYDCCPNADIASRLAKRELKAYSSGLRRLKLVMDRSAWKITPGSVIKVQNVLDHKIETIVLRVGKISKNGGTDGSIVVETMQDVYALDSTAYAYTVDTQPAWKPPVPGDTAIVPAPPLVSNLHLVKPWDGISFQVAWDRSDEASYYDVQVVAVTAANKVVRFRTHIMDNTFTYTYQDMLDDGGPWRSIEIQVRAVSYTNGTGPWFKQGLYNPQLRALTGIQVIEAMKQAFFQYNRPDENDWAGTLVYISDTSGFVPDGNTQIYDGTDLFVTMTQLADGTLLTGDKDYFIRAAGYDSFGKDSLNLSSEIVFQVVANAPDANSIVADMIKDGALDISKFARSIAAPLIVQGVPTKYAGSDVILNQLDGKLYRWSYDTLSYTANVPANDVEGQLELANIPQIPTTQLTGQIVAAQISANAIGANQIAAGAIVAGKLAADAVTAGTIAAAAISAREIASKSISTDKLLVGDMTNQLDDPDFSLGSLLSWTTPDTLNWAIDNTTANLGSDGGKGVLVGSNFGGAAVRAIVIRNTRNLAISAGDIWYASAQVKLNIADANISVYVFIEAYDANMTLISGTPGNAVAGTSYGTTSVQYQVVNPAVKFLRVGISANNKGGGSNTTKVYVDQAQMLRMSGVTLIQDGSISTQKIQASAVTGDKIVGNTITGDKIAANTITTNLLQAGSISADKLMVGFGQNLLADPGLLNNTQYWGVGGNTNFGLDTLGKITASNEHYFVVIPADQVGTGYAITVNFPIKQLTPYMLSCYTIRSGGSDAYIQLQFLDGNNNVVGVATYDQLPQGPSTPQNFNAYARYACLAVAPAGALYGRAVFVHQGSGGTYFYHPQVEEALPNQTVPGPWGASGATVIGPGNIQTGSLSAISANLGAITAGSLNINGRFVVDGAGNVTILSAASGQRMTLTNSQIASYDVNGTLRCRFGNW